MLRDASEMFKVRHVQVSRYPVMPEMSRVRVSGIKATRTRKVCSLPDAERCLRDVQGKTCSGIHKSGHARKIKS